MALACLARIDAQRPATIAGDVEALHQTRVAISQFRAIVAFFAPMTSDTTWPKLKKRLGPLYALLGDARDADVMTALTHNKRYRKWARGVDAHGLTEHDRSHRRVADFLRSARFRNLMNALRLWVAHGPWAMRRDQSALRLRAATLGTYRQQKLKRWRAGLIRRGRDLAAMGGKARHRLRIKVKRYRYALEALSKICPAGDRAGLRHLQASAKHLQHALGNLRDLQRLRRRIGTGLARPPGYRSEKKRLLKEAHAALHHIDQPFSAH